MEKSTWTLSEKAQARAAFGVAYERGMAHVVQGGRAVLELRPERRSDVQNKLLHAAISDIADQVVWHGKKFDLLTWKRLCVASWLREGGEQPELIPALDGAGFDVVYEKTSRLSTTQCSVLIEWCFAFGAEHGVNFRNMG